MKTQWLWLAFLALLVVPSTGFAQTLLSVGLINANGVGKAAGTVTISEPPYGLLLTPDLEGLTPGLHGFHVHQKPSCAPAEKNGKMVAGRGRPAGGLTEPSQGLEAWQRFR